MFADSFYDGYLYVFGKGRSETTVTVTAASNGNSVLIQGTVIDKSPGDLGSYPNPTARTDWPKNIPCVSDESMQTYMDYLYMQIPIPTSYKVTGVPVQLFATDQNGNTIQIGTTTSDLTGFRFMWTPSGNGLWTISTVFPGTNSYGSSFAGTGVIYNAPSATPTPTPTQTAPVSATEVMNDVMLAAAAIIIVIIIIGVLILVSVRRH
jgi:hypothetical protein